jgi:ClpP class serine protease
MPSLFDIQKEDRTSTLIKKYVQNYGEKADRNVIGYYSGWLSSPNNFSIGIDDMDKNGFIAMCDNLNHEKGLDLILHTPGGSIGATESIIDYLNEVFDGDIRAIVPQLAMSGGTMIACSCSEIIMGRQSSLGPVDPQIRGIPAHGVTSELEKIIEDVDKNPSRIAIWQHILSKIPPSYLDSCYKSIEWANEILEESLKNNMFKDNPDEDKIKEIVNTLASPNDTKSHSRHLSARKCSELGLNITMMEEDSVSQDLILSIHHACMTMFNKSNAFKLFVNQKGDFLDFKYV